MFKLFQAVQRSTVLSTVRRLTSQLMIMPPKDIIPETIERDLVNFPRPIKLEYPKKVYYGFIPEDWFTAFHTRTGVTGPYVFAVGMTTFLCSKEIYVLEHNFYNGISVAIVATYTVKKLGPWFAAYCDKRIDAIYDEWKQCEEKNISTYTDAIEKEKKEQWHAEGQKLLFDAKRINAAILLELEYRQRIMEVYEEIKKRLEREARLAQTIKIVTQKHISSWVANKVIESLDERFEELCLRECISELMAHASHFQSLELQPYSEICSPDTASFWLYGGYRALHCQFQLQFKRPMSLLVVFNRQEDEENKLLKPILLFIF